jgi:hypothetical protein
MHAVPPLVTILRYGTARKMPTEALSSLAKALSVEVIAGIGLGAVNLDEAAAEAMRKAMAAFDGALVLLGDDHLSEEWIVRLKAMARDPAVVPLLGGLALRRLYDRQAFDGEAVGISLSRALSPGVAPRAAGQWLEGFLGASAEIILQDDVLFGLIDRWLTDQADEDFIEVLPMLRRAFGGFGASERRRLMTAVERGKTAGTGAARAAGADDEAPGFEAALPLLFTILGIEARV